MKSVRRNKKELKKKLKKNCLQKLNIWKTKEFQELSVHSFAKFMKMCVKEEKQL